MIFKQSDILEAAKELLPKYPQIAGFLSECAKTTDRNNQVEIINRNDYFATILLSKEDIRALLIEEKGYLEEEITDEMVDVIISKIHSDYDIENCEYCYEVISAAVDDYERQNRNLLERDE